MMMMGCVVLMLMLMMVVMMMVEGKSMTEQLKLMRGRIRMSGTGQKYSCGFEEETYAAILLL